MKNRKLCDCTLAGNVHVLHIHVQIPSSQGWASRCPLLYMFVCLGNGSVSFLSYFHMLVC